MLMPYLLVLFCFGLNTIFAQESPNKAQPALGSLRGQVMDFNTEAALSAVRVEILNISPRKTTETDDQGRFEFQNLPYGRYRILFNLEGFQSVVLSDVGIGDLASAPLEVRLEAVQKAINPLGRHLETIQAHKEEQKLYRPKDNKDRPYGAFASAAARPFTVTEVLRYAGSRFDPSRLVVNFAGANNYDDARNDIVIRGNNPAGLSWLIEELPIENPNHHSMLTMWSGGVAPLLNIYTMGRADFVKGGFAAQYGNLSAGVFDLSLRSGRKDELSGLAQVGTQRAEFLLEGPLNRKKNASFIFSFRQSIGDLLFDKLINIDPMHRDFNLKLDFGRQARHELGFFALGGQSSIYTPPNSDNLADKIRYQMFEGEDHRFRGDILLTGLRHSFHLDERSFIKTILGLYHHGAKAIWSAVEPQTGNKTPSYTIRDQRQDYMLHSYWQGTYAQGRVLFRSGFLAGIKNLNLIQIAHYNEDALDGNVQDWFGFVQAYAQAKMQVFSTLQVQLGLRTMYHQMANARQNPVLDPRAALVWRPNPNHSLAFSYALVHQAPEIELRFFAPTIAYDDQGNPIYNLAQGRNLDYMRGQYLDLEYNFIPSQNWRFKFGAYYQYLNNAWATDPMAGAYSYLNYETAFYSFYLPPLYNQGQGKNMGLEWTAEKFFSKDYYLLGSLSLFSSQHRQDPNAPWTNNTYNNRYILNLLAGREFRFGDLRQHVFFADTRFSTRGGRPYRPIDVEATYQFGFQNGFLEPVYDDNLAYQVRTPAFYQVDLKFGARWNSLQSKQAHTLRVDLFNVFNIKNVFTYQYSELFDPNGQMQRGEVIPIYQRGFIPDITYTFQF